MTSRRHLDEKMPAVVRAILFVAMALGALALSAFAWVWFIRFAVNCA